MAALISPVPATPMRGGTALLLDAGSPVRDSPAAAARNNVPVRAKLPVWIQPRGPSARELTGWRSGREPSRAPPSMTNAATKAGPAARPQRSRARVHVLAVPGVRAVFTAESVASHP